MPLTVFDIKGIPGRVELILQRLANTTCDHSQVVVDGKRNAALEAVRSRDEQTESSLNESAAIHAS
jgi:hypothetical protein